MKVVHLIKTSEGASWAIDLIEDLLATYKDLTMIAVITKGGQHMERYKAVCQRVYIFDFNIGLDFYRNGIKLNEIVAGENADVIHSWFTQTTLYARIFLRKLNVPRIFQVAGPLHLENFVFRWFDILSSNKNDYWIGTSRYIVKKYLSSNVNKSRVFLNYAYIDLKKLEKAKDNANPTNYIEKYNLPKHAKIIGTASFFYPPKFYQRKGVKGHEHLFHLFSLLFKKREDLYLVVAGTSFGISSAYELKLKQYAENNFGNRVIFTGKYTNAYEVLAKMNVFVYLSRSENLGGVYESLYYKIPTLASSRGGLPELVVNDYTGYTTKLNELSKAVEKVEALLDNGNEEMTSLGYQKVRKTFNQEVILENTYRIYKTLSQDV